MKSEIICNFYLPGHELPGGVTSADEDRTVVVVMQSKLGVDGLTSRRRGSVCSGSV